MTVRSLFKNTVNLLRELASFGKDAYCPICASAYREFQTFGVAQPRRNALCPGCRSLERHRLLWVVLEKMALLPSVPGKRLLHVAPEACLASRLGNLFDYVSIDASDSCAMVQMDVTRLDFQDESFDAIICNHVLEHVADDRKALDELYRVLKKGGWASIQVPMEGEETQEDLTVSDPLERARLFGQSDHVRQYGRDFLLKLEDAGFKVQVVEKDRLLDDDTLKKIAVACEDSVWMSRK